MAHYKKTKRDEYMDNNPKWAIDQRNSSNVALALSKRSDKLDSYSAERVVERLAPVWNLTEATSRKKIYDFTDDTFYQRGAFPDKNATRFINLVNERLPDYLGVTGISIEDSEKLLSVLKEINFQYDFTPSNLEPLNPQWSVISLELKLN